MKYLNNDRPSSILQPSNNSRPRLSYDKYQPCSKTLVTNNGKQTLTKWKEKIKNNTCYPTQSVTLKRHVRSRINT